MCFVSYISIPKGYLLGSNRDEHIMRKPAQPPAKQRTEAKGAKYLSPMDGKAGGTWIGSREDGWSMVLLNGAFEPHVSQPPYRHSRGLIIPKLFEQDHPGQAWNEFRLERLEPFTLILTNGLELWEMRWDGEKRYQRLLDSRLPHSWSSATLYNTEQRQVRGSWFQTWLHAVHVPDAEALKAFHQTPSGPESFSIQLKRPDGMETVSTTIVACTGQHLQMLYADKRYAAENNYQMTLQDTNLKQEIGTKKQLV